MRDLEISDRLKSSLQNFIQGLKAIYQEGLISAILYGSAVSNEFVDKLSNLNILVVLKNTDLENLEKASGIVRKFPLINPLFMTESYIASSTDIFPIEFLDMQENYIVLYGKDALKDINIDTRNLRFQCEQELKAKLINLKHGFLRINKERLALRNLLFKSFNSALHILRNVLRIKGKPTPYKKQDILTALSTELQIDSLLWKNILAAKNKEIKLSGREAENLFIQFIRELEKIAGAVDRL
jgi:hypothetical protein